MGTAELLVIALGLAMDAFAVAITSSIVLRGLTRRQAFRLSFHFGLFQALMPVIGWAAGCTVVEHIKAWDHWVAFALLTFIGLRAIWSSLTNRVDGCIQDPTRGTTLVALSVATSIDALAVGLSFGVLNISIWFPALVIGVVAAAMTVFGLLVGRRLGSLYGKRMELVGGLVLVAIGVKILVEHLLAG
jgi:manganese efflux pump family protein